MPDAPVAKPTIKIEMSIETNPDPKVASAAVKKAAVTASELTRLIGVQAENGNGDVTTLCDEVQEEGFIYSVRVSVQKKA